MATKWSVWGLEALGELYGRWKEGMGDSLDWIGFCVRREGRICGNGCLCLCSCSCLCLWGCFGRLDVVRSMSRADLKAGFVLCCVMLYYIILRCVCFHRGVGV